MKDLKEIITNRIQSIFQLQNVYLKDNSSINLQNKYQLLLQHKKAQKMRGIRQNQLLLSMNPLTINDQKLTQELYDHTVDICSMYNKQFEKYKSKITLPIHQSLRQLFCDFFTTHGFKHKCQHVNLALTNKTTIISSSMLMGWLAQWSKKIYCQMLHKQIQKFFTQKDKNIKFTATSLIMALQRKKSQNQSLLDDTYQFSQLYMANRNSIYAFFLQELQCYYKICGMDKVDFNYLKLIKKKYQKKDFLKQPNLSKAVQNIIQTSTNKDILKTIKQYHKNYFEKFPKYKSAKLFLTKKFDYRSKKPSLWLTKKKVALRNSTQIIQQKSNSKLLTAKISQFQFLKVQQIERKLLKLRIINNKPMKNILQLPGVTRRNQFKDQLQIPLINDNSSHLIISTIANKQLQLVMQQKLKQQDFFKCQGFLFKNKKQQINSSLLTNQHKKNSQQSKIKKIIQSHLEFDYDDRKMKLNTHFQSLNSKPNNRVPTLKKSMTMTQSTQ